MLAMSGAASGGGRRCQHAALDKTGTITLGNRQATEFLSVGDVPITELARRGCPRFADETPEGRSVVVLAKTEYGLRERAPGELSHATFVAFTAQTRMSGVNLTGIDGRPAREVRKGAAGAVADWVRNNDGEVPPQLGEIVDGISAAGGTPLVVASGSPGCEHRCSASSS
jgi:K+-transporting ATPase ATPase B chain